MKKQIEKIILEALDILEASATRPGDRERAERIAEARAVVEALGELDLNLYSEMLGIESDFQDLVGRNLINRDYYEKQREIIRRITGSEEE